MTAIFLSHSSADNDAAAKMKVWLEEQGHTSLFLDFDPEAGIRAGGDWEQTLYHKLRQCQAVIALLTPNWLASKWCFAELVQAREKGKAIFPVKVQPCEMGGVFGDIQHIDLTEKAEEGYQRLALGLKERGIDPRDVYDWDPERPPYPGLLEFHEADAAIFFGRGEEILKGLETLDALRRRGRDAPRLALFLGASGSGKSSLVRAGLIPRLKKTPSEWLPVAPFRPQDDPLVEVALALAHEFKALGQPRDWREIRKTLQSAAEKKPADGRALLMLARELCEAAEQREATVVLTIDQAEELFDYSTLEAATRFLRLLRAALEASDRQLMAMATMRSDFLGEFQTHLVLHDPAYEHEFAYQAVPVDPMPERNFAEIIRGPAALAGLRLEDGLVEAMVRDTGTRDALPLLAFTLRRLYERYAQDGLLELREYDELGRLEGAIRFEAEQVLADTAPSTANLDALRAAFVPTMVRINAEGGYARRRAYADEMPPRAKILLARFVDARLLVSDRDKDGRETLEVSHEALLRTWPQLTGWLADDQDKLRLLESLHRASVDWENGGRRDDLLVHRDGRLQDAEALITNRRFAVPEDSLEKRYLDACVEGQRAREAAEREEQERRVRDAERIAEEQRKAAAAQKRTAQRTGMGLVIALLLALAAGWQYLVATENAEQAKKAQQEAEEQELEAKRQSEIAVARQLVVQAELVQNQRSAMLERSLLLAVEAMQRFLKLGENFPEAGQTLRRGLNLLPRTIARVKHEDRIRALTFSSNSKLLVTGSDDGSAGVWEASNGREVARMMHGGSVLSVAFSPKGERLATGSKDRTARIWEARTGTEVGVLPHDYEVQAVAFSADKNRLATVSGAVARVWDIVTQREIFRMRHGSKVRKVIFSPDNLRVAFASRDNTMNILEVATGHELKIKTQERSMSAVPIAFSPDGQRLATGGQAAHVWNVKTGEEVAEMNVNLVGILEASELRFDTLAFSPDGKWLAMGTNGPWAHVLDAATGQEVARLVHDLGRASVDAFGPDGKRLATRSGKTAHVWEAFTGKELVRIVHEDEVTAIAFSPDGKWVATAGADSTTRISTMAPAQSLARMTHAASAWPAIFSPHGKWLVTASEDGALRVWDVATGREVSRMPHGAGTHIGAIAFSSDSKWLATSSRGKTRVWQAATGEEVTQVAFDGEVEANSFSPDGKWLATKNGRESRVWDVETGQEVSRTSHEGVRVVRDLAFSPRDRWLATVSQNMVFLWDAVSNQEVSRMPHEVNVEAITFSPDGNWLVTVSANGATRIWETATGHVIREVEGKNRAAVFSVDGKWLATSDRRTVHVWDLASWREISRMPHEASIAAISFSPDGKWLGSGSTDRVARVWETATGREVAQMVHEATPWVVAFSSDAKILATRSRDWATSTWLWMPRRLIEEACSRLSRNLTWEEWRQYMGDVEYHKTCVNLPVHSSLIEAGRNMARTGDLEGAVIQFQRIQDLGDSLDFELRAEARRVAAEVLVTKGRKAAKSGDVESAVVIFREALGLDPNLEIRPGREAASLAAPALISKGGLLLKDGKVKDAFKAFMALAKAQEIDPEINIPARIWNQLCWIGSLTNHAAEVIDACDRAVELDPDHGGFHDSRGLAKALTGRYDDAIKDFEAYIEWGRGKREKQELDKRREWIEHLKEDRNPFDSAALDALR